MGEDKDKALVLVAAMLASMGVFEWLERRRWAAVVRAA